MSEAVSHTDRSDALRIRRRAASEVFEVPRLVARAQETEPASQRARNRGGSSTAQVTPSSLARSDVSMGSGDTTTSSGSSHDEPGRQPHSFLPVGGTGRLDAKGLADLHAWLRAKHQVHADSETQLAVLAQRAHGFHPQDVQRERVERLGWVGVGRKRHRDGSVRADAVPAAHRRPPREEALLRDWARHRYWAQNAERDARHVGREMHVRKIPVVLRGRTQDGSPRERHRDAYREKTWVHPDVRQVEDHRRRAEEEERTRREDTEHGHIDEPFFTV